MLKHLYEIEYFTLCDLEIEWDVRRSHTRSWVMAGKLSVCAWLPVMAVYRRSCLKERKLAHFEGHIAVSRHLCARVFRNGVARFREFSDLNETAFYVLPDSAPDIEITPECLRVHLQEKSRFEDTFSRSHAGVRPHNRSPSFRTVTFNGVTYRFGPVQARICQLLYEAARRGEPWQNGKQILHEAGSQSFHLANVFKRHPAWPFLIESDRRGYYRLSEAFLK